eukprot:Gb_17647 [translate_table: standard]
MFVLFITKIRHGFGLLIPWIPNNCIRQPLFPQLKRPFLLMINDGNLSWRAQVHSIYLIIKSNSISLFCKSLPLL